MRPPASLVAELEARLGPFRVTGAVGGGCIQPAVRIETESGPLFLKYGERTSAGFFATEAEGLRALAAAGGVLRVPAVVASSDVDEGGDHGWIALEWIEPGRRGRDFGVRLAEGLAALHAPRETTWGWHRPGFIGNLPQDNTAEDGWASFWWRRRLEPQLARARARGMLPATAGEWSTLADRLPELLAAGDADGPSLLHGDLWGGNILATAGGGPAVVDPATYRGHREVDLAMSELFGGLDASFYRAYDAIRPLRPGYREFRRGIYQLYYLLVHVNLFGEGYVAQTTDTLREVLAATGS